MEQARSRTKRRAQDLLDRAIAAYTDRDHPLEGLEAHCAGDKVIGLKVNGLGGKGVSTHCR